MNPEGKDGSDVPGAMAAASMQGGVDMALDSGRAGEAGSRATTVRPSRGAEVGRWHARALRVRAWLVPEHLQLGWMPVYTLGYLVFLYLPMLFGYGAAAGQYAHGLPAPAIAITLLSIPLFLPLYFGGFRLSGARATACMVGIAALACALLPFNGFANTYAIYAAGAAAMLDARLGARVGWLALVLAMFLAGVLLLGYPLFVFALTLVIAVSVFVSNHLFAENARKRAALRLSHEEVRRLAAFGERERIGRDLHDLLGHALSMVALKSELAGKLVTRDPDGARREIADVARVARDTLAQVREAVSGIRSPRLAAELASAKLLLESAGIAFRYEQAQLALPDALEHVLALAVREAATNIQRHAGARSASVSLEGVPLVAAEATDQVRGALAAHAPAAAMAAVILRVEDDGRGGAIVPGTGLAGMRERVSALGGALRIASSRHGTCVEVRLPLPAPMR